MYETPQNIQAASGGPVSVASANSVGDAANCKRLFGKANCTLPRKRLRQFPSEERIINYCCIY